MARNIRTIVFTNNTDELPELRRVLTSLPQLRIVAELDEPSLLAQAVSQFGCDLLVADLDPNPLVVIECLRQMKEQSPGVPVCTLCETTEGDLVLRAMRAGIKEYLVKPLTAEDIARVVGALGVKVTTAKEPGKLISVLGSAGGVGCTMIATNLAVELAALVGSDHMVALVDLDFRFGQVATLLDLHGQFTVADLCSTPEDLDPQMIRKALVKHDSGLYVLRRPHSFAQAEMITAAHCANVFTGLQEMCDFVVVDGPTRHDPGGRSVIDAADYNLMVLQLLVTSVRNTDRIMQELTSQGFNPDRVSFLCNRLGRDSAHLDVDQVESILNRKMFMTIADDWKAVSSSINVGQPLCVDFDRSRVRQDIRNLAMKLHDPAAFEAEAGRRGLFGKLFGKGGEKGAADESGAPAHAAPAGVS